MTRPPQQSLPEDVAREVCERTASKAYIVGSIAELGGQYVIGLNAIDCATGDALARQQVQAASASSWCSRPMDAVFSLAQARPRTGVGATSSVFSTRLQTA